jgi:hypothetical protein
MSCRLPLSWQHVACWHKTCWSRFGCCSPVDTVCPVSDLVLSYPPCKPRESPPEIPFRQIIPGASASVTSQGLRSCRRAALHEGHRRGLRLV